MSANITTGGYSCKKCKATFTESNMLNAHIRIYCPTTYKCKTCESDFGLLKDLKMHQAKTGHGKSLKVNSKEQSEADKVQKQAQALLKKHNQMLNRFMNSRRN